MKAKKKTLFSSICAIVLCLSLMAGSTFALFTSESKVDISVTSGKVKVTATVDDMTLYSATTEDTGSLAGTIASGSHAGTYYYEEVSPTFTNSGTAEYADGTLTLDRVTPGDKVNFNVGITNESNVNIKYRVLVTVTSGLKLFNALKVKIDGTSLSGVSRTGAWTSLVANGSISDIPVEIYLPIEAGNEFQDLSTNLSITVEAVQGNAYTSDGALSAVVEAIAEEVTAVDPETKKTAEETTISDGDNLVTVTIPANTKLNSEDEASSTALAVKVTPQDTVSNITVLSTQASASYDVSVLLVVNDVITEDKAVNNAENEEEITVKMFIGTGLTGVKLYHNTDEIEYDSYDSETGYLTFKTTSFSEYTVLYNKDFAYETFDEVTGESTGITVLEATETAGVYKSTDENEEEVFVTVEEDENGNVVASAGNVVLISASGVRTAYERLDTALAACTVDSTVALLKDYELPADYQPVEMFEGTLDGQGYSIYTANAINVEYLADSVTKTTVFKDFTMVESGHLVAVADAKYNYSSITFDNVDYVSTDSTYYPVDHNGSLYTSYCYDYAVGWGGTVNVVNCDVNMNLRGATSSNSAVFFGGYYFGYEECVLNVIDCSYTGTFIGNYVALVISNGQNYEPFIDNLTITGLKNYGALIGTNGAYAVGGQNHTGECSDVRWVTLYNDVQATTGGTYTIMASSQLSITVNADKTITVTDNGTGASSYSVLLYASRDVYNAQGQQYASNYNFGITFDLESAGDTDIKKLKMVDYETAIDDGLITAEDCSDEWIAITTETEYASVASYQIVTKNDVSYYIVKFETAANGNTYSLDLQEVTVFVSAFDSDGLLIAVAEKM
jgi:hypothetical protein